MHVHPQSTCEKTDLIAFVGRGSKVAESSFTKLCSNLRYLVGKTTGQAKSKSHGTGSGHRHEFYDFYFDIVIFLLILCVCYRGTVVNLLLCAELISAEKEAIEEDAEDALDAFMMSIKSGGMDTRTRSQLKHRCVALRQQQQQLQRLVKVAQPCNLPSLVPK